MRSQAILTALRTRLHPLGHLRRWAPIRSMLGVLDVPLWARVPGVDWSFRVRLVRHASLFMLRGGGEPEVTALFRVIARQIGINTFWDVGANVGYYTWLVKSIAPAANVCMFEPDADNLALIDQTLRRARLTSTCLRPVAVSDHTGRAIFLRDDISGATGTIELAEATFSQRYWSVSGKAATIDTVSLDDERVPGCNVDLVKIDVEGHEESVIRGASRLIGSDRPILIFECFHRATWIREFLTAQDYWVGDAERLSEPVDNLTSNFIALPEQHRTRLPRLKSRWGDELARLGFDRRRIVESALPHSSRSGQ